MDTHKIKSETAQPSNKGIVSQTIQESPSAPQKITIPIRASFVPPIACRYPAPISPPVAAPIPANIAASVPTMDKPKLNGKKSEKTRKRMSRMQKDIVTKWFKSNIECPYPSPLEYHELAKTTGLQEDRLKQWFENMHRDARLGSALKQWGFQWTCAQLKAIWKKKRLLRLSVDVEREPATQVGPTEMATSSPALVAPVQVKSQPSEQRGKVSKVKSQPSEQRGKVGKVKSQPSEQRGKISNGKRTPSKCRAEDGGEEKSAEKKTTIDNRTECKHQYRTRQATGAETISHRIKPYQNNPKINSSKQKEPKSRIQTNPHVLLKEQLLNELEEIGKKYGEDSWLQVNTIPHVRFAGRFLHMHKLIPSVINDEENLLNRPYYGVRQPKSLKRPIHSCLRRKPRKGKVDGKLAGDVFLRRPRKQARPCKHIPEVVG